MNINYLRKYISKLDLSNWQLIQTDINSLVIYKIKYKYTDCIYVDVDNNDALVRYEKVFDNKYLHLPIERLLISRIKIHEEVELIRFINTIIH